MDSENLILPEFHHLFLLLVTDNKCAKDLLFLSTMPRAACVTPIDTESGKSLPGPNRFNAAFHWILFCIRNNQVLINKQAVKRGTAILRRQKAKYGGEVGAFKVSTRWKT